MKNIKNLFLLLITLLPLTFFGQVSNNGVTKTYVDSNLATKENLSNKTLQVGGTSDIKYPTQKAVKSYVDSVGNLKLNISQAISFAYPKGFYDVVANSPSLSATPDGGFEQGAFYEISVAGNLTFAGTNFSSGKAVSIGDKLVKIGTQWGLMPYGESSRLKSVEAIVSNYSTLSGTTLVNGSYINSAGAVVTSASRAYSSFVPNINDNIKINTTVNGAIPVAIYVNSGGTVISTQGVGVNGSDTQFNNYYLSIPSGTATVYVNGNVTPLMSINKGTLLDQAAQKSVVDNIATVQATNTTNIANNTSVLSDYILQTVTLNNGFFMSSTGVTTSSASRTYTTFSATSNDSIKVTTQTNGSGIYVAIYKNSSNAVIGIQYQGTDNTNVNYTLQKLTIPSGTATITINGNAGVPLNVYKYGLITKSASTFTTNALNSRISNNESTLTSYKSILSSYTPQNVTIVDGAYIDYNGNVTSNTPRRYTTFSATSSDSIKVTTTINGSANYLAVYKNSAGVIISRQNIGVDGTDTPYVDYQLTIPSGTATISINGLITANIIVKKLTLMNKAVSSITGDSYNSRITTNESNISNYKVILSDYTTQSTTLVDGAYIDFNGNAITSASRRYTVISASIGDSIKVTTTINGSAVYLATFKNSSGTILGRQQIGTNGVNTTFTDYLLNIPNNTATILLNGNVASPLIVKKLTLVPRVASKEYVDSKAISDKTLLGKTVLFLGTSITEGSNYAVDAPALLGGTGINKAVGSSVVRISRADGTYTGLAWQNYCYSLGQTLAEKDYIINNWNTVRASLTNSPPTTMDSTTATFIRNCSYERRLLPYLNGTYPFPDFIIFEHGRNDGYSSDPDSVFTRIPANRVDRRTYLGAMNYLLDLIYQYNPYARVAIEGHYENDLLTRVSIAQEVLADYWAIPINKMWEKTGFNQQVVIGSQALWSTLPYSLYTSGQNTSLDMVKQRVWLPDGIHPATSTNGKTQSLLTNLVANFLKNLN